MTKTATAPAEIPNRKIPSGPQTLTLRSSPIGSTALLYAYAICLMAVAGLMIATPHLVSAWSDFGDPLHSTDRREDPSVASLETYKLDALTKLRGDRPTSLLDYEDYVPPKTLSEMYEAEKSDRIQTAQFQARRAMMSYGALAALCLVLFVSHLVLARRATRQECR